MNTTIVIKFRATEENMAEIKRQTSVAGMNVSKFLRMPAVKNQVVLYNTIDIYGLRTYLRRIGNNINRLLWWQVQTKRCACPMSESWESSSRKWSGALNISAVRDSGRSRFLWKMEFSVKERVRLHHYIQSFKAGEITENKEKQLSF